MLENLRHDLAANFWNADDWNWSLFANLLPLDVFQKIKYVQIVNEPGIEDKLAWSATASGKFSIAWAYRLQIMPSNLSIDWD